MFICILFTNNVQHWFLVVAVVFLLLAALHSESGCLLLFFFYFLLEIFLLILSAYFCLQCFDAVGWAAGRASGLWKTELWCAGVIICLQRGAGLHMTQLVPLPLTVSCFSKIQIGFTFLVLTYSGSPGQRAAKRVCYWFKTRYRPDGIAVICHPPILATLTSGFDKISQSVFCSNHSPKIHRVELKGMGQIDKSQHCLMPPVVWSRGIKTFILEWFVRTVVAASHNYIHPFNSPLSGTTRVSRYQKCKNQSRFYWSKRQWVAVASAGPYASLHLAPDR